ncbi:type I-E CRISPR-associated protein Cse2/CasB [Streptomyces pinistramenti]|uniref:type I-E CRISPR-associated protein Cse2/CasB n=1 Tax=Streptomyces pinistramenti TaxID=2884812 RepID=UPI001D05C8E7|nr:type I-E CRISPR-associated protein Cse2/CasB [Streptomyces pinistramenti]MCB5911516.1 type I-E CRISPR-associated protein Cse2/CasB [Streptomyces pinistramenti]
MSTTPQPRPAESTGPRRYWNRYVNSQGDWRTDPATGAPMRPPGEDLAGLRAGLGNAAFTVPGLWPFYTTETDGQVTYELVAEHAALSLYGLHQQSQSLPMHKQGAGAGRALRALHERYGEEAVDRRVAAAVHTTSVSALVHRLRGLVTQLRSVQQPLDYDRLLRDIRRWHFPDDRSRVRREWGLAYHSWGAQPGAAGPAAAQRP